ncbi:potassium transporter TrkA [Natronococcus sp. JC468]|uniref:potassium transporter TrkA n=1 Tax=Natronococcus sp. JC468 TaxID=1961921 RepID=UPI001439514F|nr:potassium transporter TrkA [Natronococcus sp. JC468]NKE34317.1 potassium transporter TrkA [Natronococcus sp. JC468]
MSLPVEVLLGLYLGLLTGIVPAFVAGGLGFLVRYVTGVSLPGFGVLVLALSIASVQGGLLGLVEPTIAQSPRLLVAVLVVLMLALYAHNQGDRLGAELPRRLSLSRLRRRTLSADVIEFVGAAGRVTIRPTGEIRDMEGYPPLPSSVRAALEDGSWRLPADLPLSELERRLEERLRTDHDLADVAVSLDERARASITAAPPVGGLSRRVPDGKRAVSIAALVPTGLARGDDVTVQTAARSVPGTVLSVGTDLDGERETDPGGDDAVAETSSGDGEPGAAPADDDGAATGGARASAGGSGRVTVVVDDGGVRPLLRAETPRLVVRSRGTNRDLEALALLKRAGYAVRRVAPDALGPPDAIDPSEGAVLAVRDRERGGDGRGQPWRFAPGLDGPLEPGDEAFVVAPERAPAGGADPETDDSSRGDRP